jgi:hypothetical protein
MMPMLATVAAGASTTTAIHAPNVDHRSNNAFPPHHAAAATGIAATHGMASARRTPGHADSEGARHATTAAIGNPMPHSASEATAAPVAPQCMAAMGSTTALAASWAPCHRMNDPNRPCALK